MRTPGSSWSKRDLALLGTAPDDVLARQLRRSVIAVGAMRRKQGVPPFQQPRWKKAELALLGTDDDREIARRLGREFPAVQTMRLKLGIPSWGRRRKQRSGRFDAKKVSLRAGPYEAPRPTREGILFCRIRGRVRVGDDSDAPIPWPRVWGSHSLVVCGDLVRAVREESATAIRHHWGVSNGTVTKWRKALGVESYNVGTRVLKRYCTTEAMTPALRAHLRRPKPKAWRKTMARHWAARKGRPVDPADRAWTAREHRLVGTIPDHELARQLGRTVGAVMSRRWLKQLPRVDAKYHPWTKAELKLLGRLPDDEIVRRTRHPLKSVQGKRLELGILIRPQSRPWTEREERLLGTRPDTVLARDLERFRIDVQRRRLALNIPAFAARPKFREWTPEEDALLGTASDAEIGRRLNRTAVSVHIRRRRLGIPGARLQRLRRDRKP